MTDNTSVRSGQDRTRINVDQEHEVRYWTKTLGCSEDDLRQAVRALGPQVEAVRAYLSSRGNQSRST